MKTASLFQLVALSVLLGSCATANLPSALPSSQAIAAGSGQKVSLRPLSCSEFALVTRHLGKITPAGLPDISQQDVLDRLKLPDWQAQLHHLFGDTDETLAANKANNDTWHGLCDGLP